MTKTTRAGSAIAAVCLLAVTACGGDGDDSTSAGETTATQATAAPTTIAEDTRDASATTEPAETTPTTAPPTTVAPTTEPAATTEPPATTEPEATVDASETDSDGSPVNTSPDGIRLLDFEFQAVPAGQYRVETIGAPFTIDVPEGWWVQFNSFGHFVISEADSTGPGDRDIEMIRPSNLADPDLPGAPPEEQDGDWPLDDIDGWLDALIPGVVDGDPVDTTIGGLDAVRFDVAITDEVECGPRACVGFATNRRVNDTWFDRRTGYRVWWVDGGDEAPIAIRIGDGTDPDFTEQAEAVLETVTFESVGPNPIPSEGNLWELGIASDVPAGTVTLPVGPGVTFELSEPHFVRQNAAKANISLDDPGEADILFPDEAFDGEPLETVDDVIGAIERFPATTGTVVGTRDVAGYEATEVDVSAPDAGPETPLLFLTSASPGNGWSAPPEATLWIMETPDGIAVITAEWFEPRAAEPAKALANEILVSIVIGG